MKKNYLHPVLFLHHKENSHKDEILLIKEYLINLGLNSVFIDIFSENDSSKAVNKIISTKVSDDSIKEFDNIKNVIINYPIIVSFINISNKDEVNYFFEVFKGFIEKNQFYQTTGGDYNYRFLNILIRDLERENPKNIQTSDFHKKYIDNFLKVDFVDNIGTNISASIAFKNSYNIVIDRYRNNGNSIDDVKDIFYQLGSFLHSIIFSDDINFFNLSSCYEIEDSEGINSRLTYNIFGLSSVGFNQNKVIEGISLKRKVDFLDEILNVNKLEDDTYLEITRKTQLLYDSKFQNIEKTVQEKVLSVSFQSEISTDFVSYDNRQEECNNDIANSNISIISDTILQQIDIKVSPFKEKLKNVQEKAIEFSRIKEVELNNVIKRFIKDLFDDYNPNRSIKAGVYGLTYLLSPQKVHIVTEQENFKPSTLIDKKNEVNSKIEPFPKEDSYNEEKERIKKEILSIDNRISKKYNTIRTLENSKEIKWFTKNLVNIFLLPLVGLLISIILFFNIPQIELFGWKIIDLFDKLILSIIPFLVLLIIGIVRANNLNKEIKTQNNILSELSKTKKSTIQSYINIFNTHFNLIVNKIKYQQSKVILEGNIAFVNLQIELIKRFNDSLIGLKTDFTTQFNAFSFNQDYFNKSLVGKNEIEYYCKENNLSFFSNKKLSSYFREFTDDTKFFEQLRYTNISDDVSENEVIKPNAESFKENQHIYKEIEQFETSTYLSTSTEKRDIIHSDVKQGMLGDCYLLAALASIANKKPEYIRSIIKDTEKHPIIYFYDELLQTHKVSIDKKFWIYKEEENPLYAQFGSKVDDKREIWAMLIEKGWAKINGMNYTEINGDTRSGNIRKIDYSLALTGIKAIRENLELSTNIINTGKRIVEHNTNKPVVLYSVSKINDKSDDDIITNHAYALLNIEGSKYEIYNPHGSIINIDESDLQFNFDTVLYFDFNYQEDKHLFGIYSEYFTRNTDNNLLQEFDNLIEKDVKNKILEKSLEEIIDANIFNIRFNDEKKDSFTSHIIDSSTPYVYLFGGTNNKFTAYFLGNNSHIKSLMIEKLNNLGFDTSKISTLESSEKRMGLLKLKNNIKLKNITKSHA